MSETTCYCAFFTLFFLGLYLYLCKRRPKGYPPGPRGIPLFGNAFQLGMEAHKSALEFSKEYGDILGFHVGSYKLVVLQNVDDIRELFSRPDVNSKCQYNGFADENPGGEKYNFGVKMSYGKMWHDMRHFSLKTLRVFGFGKHTMEGIILSEVSVLIDRFGKVKGQPISTKENFSAAAASVMWTIVAGERLEYEDPVLRKLIALLQDFMDNGLKGMKALGFMFPSTVTFRKKYPFLFPSNLNVFRDEVFDFLGKVVKEHRETFEQGNPRDFIDHFLEESMAAEKDPNSSFSSKMDDYGLIVLLMDLFVAGSDTSSYALTWALYLLALHPEKQDKFYQEIYAAVGTRGVLLQDRPNLPYVEATINETLRIGSITPMGGPHGVTQDIHYKGFTIPKDTTVLANYYAGHFDPDNWAPDPKVFRPERFVQSNKSGKLAVVKNKNFLPFGHGRRSCLGETLARSEIFLVLTRIIQHFHLSLPKPQDGQKYTFDAPPGFMLQPYPHKIIFSERGL